MKLFFINSIFFFMENIFNQKDMKKGEEIFFKKENIFYY